MDGLPARWDARVRAWFARTHAAPTDVQVRAWERIAAGAHVLATAPTGSGKTLAAFLHALHELGTGAWPGGGVRVVYVSPLRALNNDVRRNLRAPLRGLAHAFGDAWPGVEVAVRSGDTPDRERRRMLRRPPEVLVTTPESLNLLLASPRWRPKLRGVRAVILDEIHALAGDKRGAFLMAAVERLAALSGEFRRVALSATVRPLDAVAAFVGGRDPGGAPRPVETVEARDAKRVSVTVHVPGPGEPSAPRAPLVRELAARLDAHRSTLVFVNNRMQSERLARELNEERCAPVAWAHHGSLSRGLRELVEARLKRGELKALVATGSMELGIDIGTLDEVVLVQTPRTLSSAIQRVGRAGHAVGETSRGRLYPTHGRDLLDAAVVAPAVEERVGEAIRPVRNPLDVLAQVLVAECGVEPRAPDDLFALVRRCASFAELERGAFDRVVAMLLGRDDDLRVRELAPRLRLDPATGLLEARPGALSLVWRSGGTIPDRGLYRLRVQGSGASLGSLDEEFVWERRVGDEIAIGVQSWRVERITRDEVQVVPGRGRTPITPFWRNERQPRAFELGERIGTFLERAEARLDDDAFPAELRRDHRLDEAGARMLVAWLRRQRAVTGALPHRHRVVIERCDAGDAPVVVFHAPWGGGVLHPLQLALQEACRRRFGIDPGAHHDDDCLLLQGAGEVDPRRLLSLVRPDNLEELLRARLEHSGLFGARFRENAMRALLLPRRRARERRPLWLSRVRAGKLLRATADRPDFPIRVETWRSCLEDEFELDVLRALLEELESGAIAVHEAVTHVLSPFAEGVRWRATNVWMYEGDEGRERGGASVSSGALREVLHDSALRPRLEPELVAGFEAHALASAPGWEPEDPAARLDRAERALLVRPGPGRVPAGLARVPWGGGWLVPAALVPRIDAGRAGDPAALATLLGRYLAWRGPRTAGALAEDWELPVAAVEAALARLVDRGTVLADRFTAGAEAVEYCDTENLERLLRRRRRLRRSPLPAVPLARLPRLTARLHGLVGPPPGPGVLRSALERLFGFPAPAATWEAALLPARVPRYRPEALDALLRDSGLLWFGAGRRRVSFALRDELRLFLPEPPGPPAGWPAGRGRFAFFELADALGRDSGALADALWDWLWEGRVVLDDFDALRRGLAHRFRAEAPARGSRRRGFDRWQASRPLSGGWARPPVDPAVDGVEQAEDARDRARVLLARYGVLFPARLRAELPALRWGAVSGALRRMELSGEVFAGRFLEEVDGLQFASPEAVRILRDAREEDPVWWAHSHDPASGCGVPGLASLPPRAAGTWVVFEGDAPRLVLTAHGRRVRTLGPVEPRHLAVYRRLLAGPAGTRGHVAVESIDGGEARRSPHADAFREAGFEADHRILVLERREGHGGSRDPDPVAQ